uniref:Uncharacterized protein n=1 Tax=Arundo donax TaxID=35708 RepID=A0A0A9BMM9_ARUDO
MCCTSCFSIIARQSISNSLIVSELSIMPLNSFCRPSFVSKHLPHFNSALFFIWKTQFL